MPAVITFAPWSCLLLIEEGHRTMHRLNMDCNICVYSI
jgi:hypothetical protein